MPTCVINLLIPVTLLSIPFAGLPLQVLTAQNLEIVLQKLFGRNEQLFLPPIRLISTLPLSLIRPIVSLGEMKFVWKYWASWSRIVPKAWEQRGFQNRPRTSYWEAVLELFQNFLSRCRLRLVGRMSRIQVTEFVECISYEEHGK